MTTPRPTDLATLTLAAARTLVGRRYIRRNDGGPDVNLRLVAAEPAHRDPTADPQGDRPFALLFEGPPDPVLTQGRHDLDHPDAPLLGLFLVRIQATGAGARYEAVFG